MAARATMVKTMRREGARSRSVGLLMMTPCQFRVLSGGRSLGMSDRAVAARALNAFGATVHHVAINRRSNVLVAAAAGVLRDLMIEARDLDVVGIASGGEVKRMPEAVVGLHGILADQVVRGVAIVASGRGAMARLHPGVVLGLHHVAVGAGRRIV